MPDCLNCKKNIRREVYNQQWGMFHFSNECSIDVRIIKNGRLNPFSAPCDKFEHGEPKIIFISDKEKQKY
jgi:hypothetical protein